MIGLAGVASEVLRGAGLELRQPSVIELNRSSPQAGLVSLLVFADGGAVPLALLKVSSDPASASALEVEFDNLRQLAAHGDEAFRRTIPRPLWFGVRHGLTVLAESGLPFGVYANLGAPLDERGRARSEDCTPERFAAHAASWLAAGATLVGGCCGTTPAHIRSIAQRMRSNGVAP